MPKQAEAKRHGVINPYNNNFKQFIKVLFTRGGGGGEFLHRRQHHENRENYPHAKISTLTELYIDFAEMPKIQNFYRS